MCLNSLPNGLRQDSCAETVGQLERNALLNGLDGVSDHGLSDSDLSAHVPSNREVEPTSATVDRTRIERAVREILVAIGEDPDREGLRETPKRVARAYGEIFAGLRQDPAAHLQCTFAQTCDEVITVSGIKFYSVCEHHLLPFNGKVHIAYLPANGRVVGLSKLARTVEVFARRPQIQERLTDQIAEALTTHLQARGVIVVVEAEHMCMRMRGVRSVDAVMTTIARRGVFQSDATRSSEVMSLLNTMSRRRDNGGAI